MQYYFVEKDQWQGEHVTITGDDYHHLVNVMRKKVDDQVICSHPDGKQAICQITAVDEHVTLRIVDYLDAQTELPIDVTIVQGLPKGDKLDCIVQKATELGARSFVPFNAVRSIVKWDQKKEGKKLARLQKIVKEASEQSHRQILPEIHSVQTLMNIVELSQGYDHLFMAYEETARELQSNKLSHHFEKIQPGDRVLIVIGPEGGLDEKEVHALYEAQFQAIRLGPRILRTETAPLYLLSALSYYFEETE